MPAPTSTCARRSRRRCGSARALEAVGATAEEIAAVEAMVRKLDEQRFELELVGGHLAGRALFSPKVEPPSSYVAGKREDAP